MGLSRRRVAILAAIAGCWLSTPASGETIFSSQFAALGLGSEWHTQSSKQPAGHIAIEPIGGRSEALRMATKGDYQPNRNQATLSVDLDGHSDIRLDFDHYTTDSFQAFPSAAFTGDTSADGIALSENGSEWYPLWSEDIPPGSWQSRSVDLSQAMANFNFSSPSTIQIRFQHYMQSALPGNQERGWDNIQLTSQPSGAGMIPEPTAATLWLIGAAAATRLRFRRRTKLM